MQRRTLGQSGLEVSALGLGCGPELRLRTRDRPEGRRHGHPRGSRARRDVLRYRADLRAVYQRGGRGRGPGAIQGSGGKRHARRLWEPDQSERSLQPEAVMSGDLTVTSCHSPVSALGGFHPHCHSRAHQNHCTPSSRPH